jgi:methylenetetrahydrofolate dehydrogenase (NADP+)/methenyltetrahydrofolate cyclohydrolase|nr:bifunctional methylenetetrahydrofolate dehydrogenase/methenyltetrahydrofolate cyclohydrolase FolD [Candidatus Krumholzibacteria bacterium]
METLLLKGNVVRDQVLQDLKAKVALAKRPPGLAVVLVGDDPASAVYVSHKEKGCEEVGFHHETNRLPADATQEQVLDLIARLNGDPTIDGILVQLPLPGHLDQEKVLMSVDPAKDVDGFHPENLGRLTAGHPRFVPCTPKGVLKLLQHYQIPVSGKHVVIVGRSVIVGRPLTMLLSLKRDDANATVTMCHSGTRDLAAVTSQADVVVAAIGVPRFLGPEEIAEGSVVVDVGINRIDAPERKSGTRLVGDVDYDRLLGRVAAMTPVPGGVGPMTIAMLLENTYEAMLQAEGRVERP